MTDISKKRWALFLTSLAAFMVVLDSQIMTVALTSLRASLGASLEALQWTVNAYTLTFAVLLLTGAALGDRFGRRRVFATGIALFVAASVACALAPNVAVLIVARTIQGVGGALILPLSLTLLTLAFPANERGKAIGIFTSFVGAATIAGPLLGGGITQVFSWHAIFWLNVPIGLIALPLVLTKLDESCAESASFDFAGLALATLAAFGFVWGLLRGGAEGWSNPAVITALGGAMILTLAFIAWEARTPNPMIPLRLFESRAFSAGNVTNMLFNGSMYGTLFLLPQYLQTAQHDSPLAAGEHILPWTATLFVVAPLAGALVDRIGERALITIGLLVQGAGSAWFAASITPNVPYAHLIAPLIVTGVGLSLAIPSTQRLVFNAIPRADLGKGSGTFTMLRYLGGIFGIAVLVAIFNRFGSIASPQAFSAGFGPAMWAAAAFAFLAAGAALATREPVAAPKPAALSV